jgi:hypothetical protein
LSFPAGSIILSAGIAKLKGSNMAESKTKPTEVPVRKFIDSIQDEQKQTDALEILEMMQRATKLEPRMWGTAIIGFGSVHYKYDSGREGDICLMGFSPRKQNFSLYLPGGHTAYAAELKQLGTFETGKGCLYIRRLAEVDKSVLKRIFEQGAKSASK